MSDERIYGIDLGTTYSAISYIDEYGQPVVVLNEDDEPVTASAIFFETSDNVIVGKVAKTSGRVNPSLFLDMIKPEMGNPNYRREFHGKEYRPEQLSALILGKLKSYAENRLGTAVKNVAITVPGYFNEQQRNATEQAGLLAGLNVRCVIPEPTAAAIAYAAADSPSDGGNKTVLVYDLGGGTFDVTVMRIEGSKIRVVGVKGDHVLGGRHWDDSVIAYLASEWQKGTGDSDDPLSNAETLQELINSAEEAKKQLSSRLKVPLKVNHAGRGQRVELTRETFDSLTAPLLEKTMAMTRDAHREALENGAPSIDLILLVGGSSRMPQVAARLQQEFPGVEQRLFDPELSVAKGAAIYANSTRIQEIYADIVEADYGCRDVPIASLSDAKQREIEERICKALPGTTRKAISAGLRIEVINVCSKNFGLIVCDPATRREEVCFLIKRNSPVPATVREEFATLDDNQAGVSLRIIESSAETGPGRPLSTDPSDPTCHRLKEVTLELPAGLRAGHPILVEYSLSEDGGRLRVHAKDPVSNVEIEVNVENLGALQPRELEQMKREIAAIKLQ
jgi:molecular chaperone DnaK